VVVDPRRAPWRPASKARRTGPRRLRGLQHIPTRNMTESGRPTAIPEPGRPRNHGKQGRRSPRPTVAMSHATPAQRVCDRTGRRLALPRVSQARAPCARWSGPLAMAAVSPSNRREVLQLPGRRSACALKTPVCVRQGSKTMGSPRTFEGRVLTSSGHPSTGPRKRSINS